MKGYFFFGAVIILVFINTLWSLRIANLDTEKKVHKHRQAFLLVNALSFVILFSQLYTEYHQV